MKRYGVNITVKTPTCEYAHEFATVALGFNDVLKKGNINLTDICDVLDREKGHKFTVKLEIFRYGAEE